MKFTRRTLDLLAQSNTLASSAMVAAAAKLKEENEKKEQEVALQILKHADEILAVKVSTLKVLRAKEKAAKLDLKKFDSAFAKFIKDGDFESFIKEVNLPSYMFGVR